MNHNKSEYLYDHIDAPIRKAVAGLNLLGFTTHFSCCGFDYEGQPEDKSHIPFKPYVFLDYTQVTNDAQLVHKLGLISLLSGWRFGATSGRYIDFYPNIDINPNNPWNKKDSRHAHEVCVLAIKRLEDTFNTNYFKDSAEIVDGNVKFSDYKYWQYKPCPNNWIITKEEWETL